jgi:hypothetical protein
MHKENARRHNSMLKKHCLDHVFMFENKKPIYISDRYSFQSI